MSVLTILENNKEQIADSWFNDIIKTYNVDKIGCQKFFRDYFLLILKNVNQHYPKSVAYLDKSLKKGFLQDIDLSMIFEFHLSLKRVLRRFFRINLEENVKNYLNLLNIFTLIDNYFLLTIESFGSNLKLLVNYSKHRYDTLTENISEIVYHLSPQGTFIYITPSFNKKYLGSSIEKLKSIDDLIKIMHEEDRDKFMRGFINQLKNKRNFTMELRLIDKRTNKTLYFVNKSYPCTDSHGNLIYVHGILYDITLLKSAITEHKQTEKKMRQTVRNSTIMNWLTYIFLTIPFKEALTEMLKVIMRTMESKYGIFGRLTQNKNLVCDLITKENGRDFKVNCKDTMFPHKKWNGILGQILMDKKVIYTDKPLHIDKYQFPVTDSIFVPVSRVIGMPITYQENIIGLLAIANSNKGNYYCQEDYQLMENITEYLALTIHANLEKDSIEKSLTKTKNELKKYRKIS